MAREEAMGDDADGPGRPGPAPPPPRRPRPWLRRPALAAVAITAAAAAVVAIICVYTGVSGGGGAAPPTAPQPPVSSTLALPETTGVVRPSLVNGAGGAKAAATALPGEEEEESDEDEDEPEERQQPVPPPSAAAAGAGAGPVVPAAPTGEGPRQPPDAAPVPGGSSTCMPQDGAELKRLVEESTCAIVALAPGASYELADFIRVPAGRRVTVIGRPLDMPTIDAYKVYRAFTVEAGGFLDLRYVRVFRGKPVWVVRRYYAEIRGAAIYVRAGGRVVVTGCFFTVNPRRIREFLYTPDMQTTLRLFGGYILQEAGTLTVTDSGFAVIRPGVLFREVYTVGGQVLVLGGSAVLTGCVFSSTLLFVNVVGVGDTVAVFGGLAIFTGCVFNFNAALAAAQGVGLMLFLGGGVAVLTGCSGSSNIGAHTFFGAGGAIFLGGGVGVITGVSLNGVVSLLAGAGAGSNIAVGSGVFIKTGMSQTGNVAINMVAFLGIAVFVGSGTVVHSEVVWSRVASLTAGFGAGHSLYLGSGAATIVNSFGFITNVIGYMAVQGGHICVFSGWLTTVNLYMYKFEGIIVHFGQGTEILLIAGGAVLVNTGYEGGAYALFFGNPEVVKIWIAGHVVHLRNDTYHGALVTRKRLVYFPKRSYVKVAHLSLADSTPTITSSSSSSAEALAISPPEAQRKQRDWAAGKAAALTASIGKRAAAGAGAAGGKRRRLQSGDSDDGSSAWAPATLRFPGPGYSLEAPASLTPGTKTRGIVIASAVDGCSVCDVRPSSTAANLGGDGARNCTVSDTCPEGDSSSSSSDGGFQRPWQEEEDQQRGGAPTWDPPAGAGPANTSVAVLQLAATYTPGADAALLDRKAVAAAVQVASQRLGLPQRFLVRAGTDLPNPLLPGDDDYVASVRAEGASPQEEGATRRRGQEEEEASQGSCARAERFPVYLLSDWRNVTQALAQGLRGGKAAEALAAAFRKQQEQQAQADDSGGGDSSQLSLCDLRVAAASALFVPGLTSSGPERQDFDDGASSSSGTQPKPSSLFAGLKGGLLTGNGGRRLGFDDNPSLPAAAELVEADSGERVSDVVPGRSYSLLLRDFPPDGVINVYGVAGGGGSGGGKRRLVAGPLTVAAGSLLSLSQDLLRWEWTVGDDEFRPGAYYLEILCTLPDATSTAPSDDLPSPRGLAAADAFAFTQAFEVM